MSSFKMPSTIEAWRFEFGNGPAGESEKDGRKRYSVTEDAYVCKDSDGTPLSICWHHHLQRLSERGFDPNDVEGTAAALKEHAKGQFRNTFESQPEVGFPQTPFSVTVNSVSAFSSPHTRS